MTAALILISLRNKVKWYADLLFTKEYLNFPYFDFYAPYRLWKKNYNRI